MVEKMMAELTEATERIYQRISRGLEVLSSPLDTRVGTTPAELVYEEDKLKLYHYYPLVKKPCPIPILIVYALVNRQYMLDLQPDRSVVRNLLKEGLDLYIIDWGYPTRGDRFLTLDDYINRYLNNCVDVVRKRAGVKKVSIYGVCQGGTLSIMYAALYPEKINALVMMNVPVNFDTDEGLLHIWARHLDVDKLVDTFGNVPGEFLNFGFLLLNPFRLLIHKYVNFLEHIEDKDYVSNFIRMEKWIFDSPDQAGEAFRQFIRDCYQKNLLIQNKMVVGGKRIDLGNIKMPVLNVFGEQDHIIPPSASRPFTEHIPSKDKETIGFPTGHIGMFVGSASQEMVCPKIASWLKARSGGRIKNNTKIKPAKQGKGVK